MNNLLTAQESCRQTKAAIVARDPVPEHIVEAINDAINRGEYRCTIDRTVSSMPPIILKLEAAGYTVRNEYTSKTEPGDIVISWGRGDDQW